ncbi:MAG TPA: MBL fold metallo-hydrolase [Dehalococcoidia bacterium]|jgi:L-ascorbate metabolism protein UlaG (beta-lactamase superfamily)|nr:MBL fold metallo-hydrolase [Dehalococcoidia bacterium]
MEIVWLGHSCFRIRGREATVVCDPCPPSTGYQYGKPTADIITISHNHPDHNYVKGIAGGPTVIVNAGEYEIHGAFITGIATYHDNQKGEEHGRNLAFVIEMEDIKVCHLGDLGHTPNAEQVEDMVGSDVVLIPVGGKNTIDGAKAAEIVSLLEAKLVVPMHYKTDVHDGGLETAERFLKEMQATAVQPQPKLQITRSSVPSETQVVLLDYKGKS